MVLTFLVLTARLVTSMTWYVFNGTLTQCRLISRVVILLAYTTQHLELLCSMPILHILQLLQYAGMSVDSACGSVYRRPSCVKHTF